jgi:hypothetical protein
VEQAGGGRDAQRQSQHTEKLHSPKSPKSPKLPCFAGSAIVVVSVSPQGWARHAGVLPGFRLLAVNGHDLSKAEHLNHQGEELLPSSARSSLGQLRLDFADPIPQSHGLPTLGEKLARRPLFAPTIRAQGVGLRSGQLVPGTPGHSRPATGSARNTPSWPSDVVKACQGCRPIGEDQHRLHDLRRGGQNPAVDQMPARGQRAGRKSGFEHMRSRARCRNIQSVRDFACAQSSASLA